MLLSRHYGRHEKRAVQKGTMFPCTAFSDIYNGIGLCRNWQSLKISVEHHSRISAGDVRVGIVMPRILVGHHDFLHIIHRVQGHLVAFPEEHVGKMFQGAESVVDVLGL